MNVIDNRPRIGPIELALALSLVGLPAAAQDEQVHLFHGFRISVDTVQVGADGPYPVNELKIDLHYADGRLIRGVDMAIDGVVSQSWVRDLDGDGNPEIIAAVQGFGSGSYGELVFFEYENDTFVLRLLPRLPAHLSSGYMGHDTFAVDDVAIRRRFPVYAEADANCCPTGGTMEIAYTYSADRFYVTDVDRDR